MITKLNLNKSIEKLIPCGVVMVSLEEYNFAVSRITKSFYFAVFIILACFLFWVFLAYLWDRKIKNKIVRALSLIGLGILLIVWFVFSYFTFFSLYPYKYPKETGSQVQLDGCDPLRIYMK